MRRNGMKEGGSKIDKEGEGGGLDKSGPHWLIYLSA